jgi:hypothetical protein
MYKYKFVQPNETLKTRQIVQYLHIPCDQNGWLLWEKQPTDCKTYMENIKKIFHYYNPTTTWTDDMEQAVLDIRYMAAASSLKNLERSKNRDSKKLERIRKLRDIQQSIEAYSTMSKIKKELQENLNILSDFLA